MKATLLDDKYIKIEFFFNQDNLALVKSLPDRRYNPGGKFWIVPIEQAPFALPPLERAGFVIDDEIRAKFEVVMSQHVVLQEIAKQDDVEFDSVLPLLPYQKVGAKFMVACGSALLGDDVGLGKTIQSLAACEALDCKKVLIFCPSVLKYQWQAEIIKFLPDATTLIIEGNAAQRQMLWRRSQPPGFQYIIANYEQLIRDFDVMGAYPWDAIIADEATKIANPKTKTTKAIKKLVAKHRFPLTGTPVSNKPTEIWSIIDFVRPGALGKYWGFIERYTYKNNFGAVLGYRNMPELAARIKPYLIRRLKRDVLTELPPVMESDVPFKLSPAEAKLYDQIRKEVLFQMEAGAFSKVNDPMGIQHTLAKMTRLRQLCDSMELLGDNKTSTKLEALKELLLTLDGRKAIIFTEFREMALILARELKSYNPGVIAGGIDNETRAKTLKAFNDDGTKQLLIMTSAGKFGLNVQAASVVIHYDQPWSLASKVQRDGRADRKGQTADKVLIYNLLAKGSIDMYIRQVLAKKADISNQILQDRPVIGSMEEIKEALEQEPEFE